MLSHRLLKCEVPVLEHLLLDDVLFENLIVELERLLINQAVVKTFAVSRLDDVALRVDTVLVAFVGRPLMLFLKLLLLLHRVRVVLHETPRRRDLKLVDSAVVELINCLVECISVDSVALRLQLGVQLSELVLNRLRLELELLVIEAVLRFAVHAELLHIRVFEGLLALLLASRLVPQGLACCGAFPLVACLGRARRLRRVVKIAGVWPAWLVTLNRRVHALVGLCAHPIQSLDVHGLGKAELALHLQLMEALLQVVEGVEARSHFCNC